MMTNGNRNPEEIELEIQETRSRVDDTISAIQDKIQDKFSPGPMLEQAMDYMRQNGTSDFIADLTDTIKKNPVPVAMVGIGIAWLMSSDNRHKASRTGVRHSSYRPATSDKARIAMGYRTSGSVTAGLKEKVDTVKHKAMDLAETAQRKVKSVARGALDQIDEVKARHSASSSFSSAASQSSQPDSDKIAHVIKDQPLVFGALGIAIGAALGAALPATYREDELMGKTRDDVVAKANQLGQEQLSKAKTAVKTAKDNVLNEIDKAVSETS